MTIKMERRMEEEIERSPVSSVAKMDTLQRTVQRRRMVILRRKTQKRRRIGSVCLLTLVKVKAKRKLLTE